MKKSRKAKITKIDGLGPQDLRKIRAAIRQIWHRSYARRLAAARAIGPDGFPICEKCRKKVPKTFIDHKIPAGEIDGGFIKRMFVPSKELQAWCKKCHDEKTKKERAVKARSKKKKEHDWGF